MVTLPDGMDACDIGTITIWCQPFRAIFTRLAIPRSTFVSIVWCQPFSAIFTRLDIPRDVFVSILNFDTVLLHCF